MPRVEFKAPGLRSWELSNALWQAGNAVREFARAEPLARAFGEGTRRYGLLLDTLRMRFTIPCRLSIKHLVAEVQPCAVPAGSLVFDIHDFDATGTTGDIRI